MTDYIHKHRIRYADTDQMRVAYHGRYFEWFEAARTEMLREMGVPYDEIEKQGIMLPVVEAGCKYGKSVVYDDLIEVRTRIESISRSRLRLVYDIWIHGEDRARATGFTEHCYLNAQGRPIRASHQLVQRLKGVS